MKRISATALTTWIFVIYPLLCTSGLAAHECAAQEDCVPCRLAPCHPGHACHRDPCRVDATPRRPKNQEDHRPARPIEACAVSAAAIAAGSQLLTLPPVCASHWPNAPAADSARVLPLLV